MSGLQKLLIVLLLELFGRKDQVKITGVLHLVIVPLSQFLRPQLLFLLNCHLGFALDGPSLELESFLLFELHLFKVAQIEKLNHISDQILLHFEIER